MGRFVQCEERLQGILPAERLDNRVTEDNPARLSATTAKRARTITQAKHFEVVADRGYSSG